jgi:hypothetical protein
MSQRPLTLDVIHFDDDRFGFRLANPDGQNPVSIAFLKYQDIRVCGRIETNS